MATPKAATYATGELPHIDTIKKLQKQQQPACSGSAAATRSSVLTYERYDDDAADDTSAPSPACLANRCRETAQMARHWTTSHDVRSIRCRRRFAYGEGPKSASFCAILPLDPAAGELAVAMARGQVVRQVTTELQKLIWN